MKLRILAVWFSMLIVSCFAQGNSERDVSPRAVERLQKEVRHVGRNTYRGDSSYTTDMRMLRMLKVREKLSAEISAEVFNLFNRQNIKGIDTVYGAATFLGAPPRKFGDGITSPANPKFGSPNFVASARQLQLSVRLNF